MDGSAKNESREELGERLRIDLGTETDILKGLDNSDCRRLSADWLLNWSFDTVPSNPQAIRQFARDQATKNAVRIKDEFCETICMLDQLQNQTWDD